jgi:hypothetical protein
LNEWEADPSPSEGRRLIDVETQGAVDLLLDRKTVAGYRERLARLQEGLGRSCRCAHGRFVTLIADRGLPSLCRTDLCAAGLLVPAA